jgi:hypothetical protein
LPPTCSIFFCLFPECCVCVEINIENTTTLWYPSLRCPVRLDWV